MGDGERLIKVTRGELSVGRGETGRWGERGSGDGSWRGKSGRGMGDTEGAGTAAGGVAGDMEGDEEGTTEVVTGRFTGRGG